MLVPFEYCSFPRHLLSLHTTSHLHSQFLSQPTIYITSSTDSILLLSPQISPLESRPWSTHFQGVKNAASGAYYYDEHDIQRVKVPLADCQGDYILSKDELKRCFGLDAERLGPIPEYLIAPRLNSTWNGSRSNTTGRSWWDITGEVVAYKPIA